MHELRLGILDHDVDGLWSHTKRERGYDINAEAILSPSWHLRGGTVRPDLDFSVNDRGLTGKAYADALRGGRNSQYSIRINDKWCVCSRWTDAGAENVEIVDYH